MTTQTTATTAKAPSATTAKSAPKKKREFKIRKFNTLGKFFASLRIDLNMSTEEWAKQVGVGTITINNLEKCEESEIASKLSLETALKLAKALKSVGKTDDVLQFQLVLANTLGVVAVSVLPQDIAELTVKVATGTIKPVVQEAVSVVPAQPVV